MKKDILEFPFDYTAMSDSMISDLESLAKEYIIGLNANSYISKRNLGEKMGEVEFTVFKPKFNKGLLDKIDDVFGRFFGFSQEDIAFIKNYDYRLRMGDDSGEGDE